MTPAAPLALLGLPIIKQNLALSIPEPVVTLAYWHRDPLCCPSLVPENVSAPVDTIALRYLLPSAAGTG
jgi:hypothetical protein